ncbi:MAG: M28 family peptidase, partial [Chloroflexota bacterium]
MLEPARMAEIGLERLQALGRFPSVPYHEGRVAAYVRSACEHMGIEAQADRFGNVMATLPGEREDVPGVLFVAHMDHPGFEAITVGPEGVRGRVLGNVPSQGLEAGVPVQLVLPGDDRVTGKVTGKTAGESGQSDVLFHFDSTRLAGYSEDLPLPVVFDLPEFDLDDDSGLIRMRAADDLAGCAAMLTVLAACAGEKVAGPVRCLFTRAEEVGLVGARLAALEGHIPRESVVVSIETSSTLPGAEIGSGPVIRTGDRATTFSHQAEDYL